MPLNWNALDSAAVDFVLHSPANDFSQLWLSFSECALSFLAESLSGSVHCLPSVTMIDQRFIQGEPHTGFEKAGDLGEFECGNCSFMQEGCNHPLMMLYSKEPRLPNGHVYVEDEDCCEYVDRVGKPDLDVNEALDTLISSAHRLLRNS